jgi:hypothetical protein
MAKGKPKIETYRSDTGGIVKIPKGGMDPSKKPQKQKRRRGSTGALHNTSGLKEFKGG